MTIDVGIVARFTAEHHLVGDFGPASVPHRHAYRAVVEVSGHALQSDGTLVDITVLQGALETILEPLRGRDLNPLLEPAIGNPTAEGVARFLHERLAPALRGRGLGALRVEVWESTTAYARWSGPVD